MLLTAPRVANIIREEHLSHFALSIARETVRRAQTQDPHVIVSPKIASVHPFPLNSPDVPYAFSLSFDSLRRARNTCDQRVYGFIFTHFADDSPSDFGEVIDEQISYLTKAVSSLPEYRNRIVSERLGRDMRFSYVQPDSLSRGFVHGLERSLFADAG